MATKRDYYQVLNVVRTAGDKEVAAAYRKLAIRYHPDSNPDDPAATEKFKEAAEAYEVLRDPEKRARYDRFGHAGVESGGAQFHSVEDIFEAFGDMFGGGIFGDLFGGRRQRRRRRGADLKCDVELSLEEAAKGVKKTVRFGRSEVCGTCGGSGAKPGSARETCRQCGGRGQVVQSAGILRVQTACPACRGAGSMLTDVCEDCRGQGATAKRVEMNVVIPAGIDDGMRIRMPNEGEPSPDGGPPGDCYCFVSVRRHELFERQGNDLVLQLPITYCQATLGAIAEVPTLDGPDALEIPRGTQSGDVFRLRGRGVPDPRGGPSGDLLIQTHIETPRKLTAKQEDLLRQLAELEHTHVTPHRKTFLEKIRGYFTSESPDGAAERDRREESEA
ncbi:MAG: molecular chaperone DnaJ [Planctomycetes bacterium]|nr:molecular chaperone DnaJ [Planctomycetota bacterium]